MNLHIYSTSFSVRGFTALPYEGVRAFTRRVLCLVNQETHKEMLQGCRLTGKYCRCADSQGRPVRSLSRAHAML